MLLKGEEPVISKVREQYYKAIEFIFWTKFL